MRAAVITRPGGAEVLEVQEREAPKPGAGEVLIRVKASGLNRADVLQRQGKYPAPPGYPQDIPGIEFAGEIAELGQGVAGWQRGERVFGITGGGAHAQMIAAHHSSLAPVPGNLSWTQAAAVPEAFITAHDALFTQAGLRRGESLLVHAIGSGVGLAALALGLASGVKVFGTSRTQDKLDRARSLGMSDGLWLPEESALAKLAKFGKHATAGGFDVVFDLAGGPYAGASLAAMAMHGRLMAVGAVAGATTTVDLRVLLHHRLRILGTMLRGRNLEEKAAATHAFARDVAPQLGSGKIQPVIDAEFPLEHVAEAHRRMESDASFGKIVLQMD